MPANVIPFPAAMNDSNLVADSDPYPFPAQAARTEDIKIVLVTGGYRTGSTLIYNVVREILRHTGLGGRPISLGASIDEVDQLLRLSPRFLRDWYVVKVHNYRLGIADWRRDVRVIHSARPISEMIASAERIEMEGWMSKVEQSVAAEMHYRRLLEDTLWGTTQIPFRLFEFAELRHCLVPVIESIARFLGAELHDWQRDKIAQDLDIRRVKEITDKLTSADPDAEWRPGHVTSLVDDPATEA